MPDPVDSVPFARLESALLSLPARRREIFLAVRFDALSYRAIAQATGLTAKQVERELARALAHIDLCLDDRASPATPGEAVRTGIGPLG